MKETIKNSILISRFINEKNSFTLNYHNSWNSLMPVVDKINNIQDEEHQFLFFFEITPNCCNVFKRGDKVVSNEHGATFIEMVYITVVLFIEWYNENHK